MRYCYCLILLFFYQLTGAQTLVLPGDNPDPSVVKIGDRYWATATTSNWAPVYPLLESKDLVTWHLKSAVFTTPPAWADFYFWAPEMTYENGKVYLYYAAHKRNGNLCLGIASADQPEGPYHDHGPLMCQEAGSIDAFPMRDRSGKLYLIWKEDGNSVKLPTPIWAMALNEERTQLTGEKTELFRNDAAWEGNLVEGVSMIEHGEYYYAFYAGAGCCGRTCNYGVGVARAKDLLGPWEKYNKNPLLASGKKWKCPGHGTPVEKDGKFYFLFHAYHPEGDVYVGRQGVLSEFTFTADGWIEFQDRHMNTNPIPARIVDEFDRDTLSLNWQWSVLQPVDASIGSGALTLHALPGNAGAFIGQKTYTTAYDATIVLDIRQTNAIGGLALTGDEKNLICAVMQGNTLMVRKLENGTETILAEKKIKPVGTLQLRATVRNGKDVTFSYSTDGEKFISLNEKSINAFYLPPWDRAVRVGILSKGETNKKTVVNSFSLVETQ